MSELRWPFILCYFAIKIEFFGLNRQQVNWSKKLHGYFSQNSKMAYLGRYEPLTNTDKNRKLIQPGRFWTLKKFSITQGEAQSLPPPPSLPTIWPCLNYASYSGNCSAHAIQDGGHNLCQPASFGDRYLRYTAWTRICISFQDSVGDPHRNATKL